jgi:hypothetical protein
MPLAGHYPTTNNQQPAANRHPTIMTLGQQVVWLVILAIPIASISWTITQEELFREPRDFCFRMSREPGSWSRRKFFYLFTCHYCFSHYVSAVFLALTHFKLLYLDWRGYLISLFALVYVANFYMSVYAWLRQEFKREKYEARIIEHEAKEKVGPKIEKPAA